MWLVRNNPLAAKADRLADVSLSPLTLPLTESHSPSSPSPLRVRISYLLHLQLIERNREVAHALSSRVVNRVRNCRRDADNADLAEALDAERIDGVIRLVNEDDLDVVHVSVHWDMILGDVGIHDAAEPMIKDRKSTRLNSSHLGISYAVFCLKKKKNQKYSNSVDKQGSHFVHIAGLAYSVVKAKTISKPYHFESHCEYYRHLLLCTVADS